MQKVLESVLIFRMVKVWCSYKAVVSWFELSDMMAIDKCFKSLFSMQ